jgi:hypothetical protein
MDEPELKFIDGFTRKLRKKLANTSNDRNCIETVWGRGYMLREPSEDEAKIPAWLWSPPPETAGFFSCRGFSCRGFFSRFLLYLQHRERPSRRRNCAKSIPPDSWLTKPCHVSDPKRPF